MAAAKTQEEYQKYLAFVQQHDWQPIILGAICPPQGHPALSRLAFANGKYILYYHLNVPAIFPAILPTPSFTAYIGPGDGGPDNCFDWAEKGFKVNAIGPDGHWGPCMMLRFAAGVKIQIQYPFEGETYKEFFAFPLLDLTQLHIHYPFYVVGEMNYLELHPDTHTMWDD
ncbi:hypothetical protein ONZ45_g7203 [Pleurotus djamor]|nr:hypothetical protein ONZ45_g7203 [Pleurotus djamor]